MLNQILPPAAIPASHLIHIRIKCERILCINDGFSLECYTVIIFIEFIREIEILGNGIVVESGNFFNTLPYGKLPRIQE